MRIGAHYLGDKKCEFIVWAPFLKKVELKIISPVKELFPMEKDKSGYWKTVVEEIMPGIHYYYRLEEQRDRPDPASFFQPEGVHGPSEVIDHTVFDWEESEKRWRGIGLRKMIIYETHAGTFTPQGTFEAIIARLDELSAIGINALELMPVAQFPGERNWGYDGVYPFAVQNSYGRPRQLKQLVMECHKKGIAVILDVVYNHFGPEGNYIWDFGPYFSGKYITPWGKAINFDDAYSDEVRNFFIENALYWFTHYHIDCLRLDAIHAIYDMSAVPFLQELAERVEEFSDLERRTFYLIAESDLNNARVIRPRELGGYQIDAQWFDEYHHCLHTLLTEECQGYYLDFGKIEHMVKSLREGFVYSGQYSRYRKRRFGNSSKDRPGHQFIVFAQNHDQIGNRMLGERLSALVSFEALKLCAGIVFFSPYLPLLFMGEEYGEESPFHYFVSHSDPNLIKAVRKGRKEEFREFIWRGAHPNPQSTGTFLQSKIKWERREEGKNKVLLNYYRKLITLRREIPALSNLDMNSLYVKGFDEERVIFMSRWTDESVSQVFCLFNFNKEVRKCPIPLPVREWEKMLDSSDTIWNGPGALAPNKIAHGEKISVNGHSVIMYRKK